MDQKTRHNIRLAGKEGVTIRPVAPREEIETFYRILVDTARPTDFLIRPAGYFWTFKSGWAQGKAQFSRPSARGNRFPGPWALTHGKTTWYALRRQRQHRPSIHAQPSDAMDHDPLGEIQRLHALRFRVVPSNLKPEDPCGLYRFKKGFGAELTEFVGGNTTACMSLGSISCGRQRLPIFMKIWRAILLLLSPFDRPEAD
ncbi:MAG: peptidoglycan bridge formation glycyltransferase FemA/FemB family protein [Elusimicrobia bacterium]|nr:peptidoglycan bridge formation glycyltransferase FemA/FemB family protein [Elusimicrobiota bacterium]